MNGGLIGLLFVAVALGIGVFACWKFGTTLLSRYTPGALAAAYYTAMLVWPHPSVYAYFAGDVYPDGEQVRVLLLGLTVLIVVIELVARLTRSVRTNAQLRQELRNLKENL